MRAHQNVKIIISLIKIFHFKLNFKISRKKGAQKAFLWEIEKELSFIDFLFMYGKNESR